MRCLRMHLCTNRPAESLEGHCSQAQECEYYLPPKTKKVMDKVVRRYSGNKVKSWAKLSSARDESIKKARKMLTVFKKQHKLTDNQVTALSQHPKSLKELNESQRDQIIDILKDCSRYITKRKGIK